MKKIFYKFSLVDYRYLDFENFSCLIGNKYKKKELL